MMKKPTSSLQENKKKDKKIVAPITKEKAAATENKLISSVHNGTLSDCPIFLRSEYFWVSCQRSVAASSRK